MSNEKAIKRLKSWLGNGSAGMTSDRLGYIEGWFSKDDVEAFKLAIKALEQQSSEEYNYKALWNMVKKERDIAIGQLHELGYEFGEKIRADGDCISREEIIEKYKWILKANKYGNKDVAERDFSYSTMMMYEVADIIDDIISDIPSGTPKQIWIPVSERLPEEETDVLICNIDGDIALSRGSYSTEVKDDFIWYTSGWRFGKVIAWMPLPQPYKEVEE